MELVNVEDAYSFRKDLPKWNQWMQRPALWLLRKLGAYRRETVAARVHTVPRGTLLQQMQQTVQLMRPDIARTHNIVIGAKTYQELAHSEDVRSSFAFTEQLGFKRRLYDVRLIVVPNVEGWAIVPQKPDVELH